MVAFPKPAFTFNFDVQHEIAQLRQHKTMRGIPDKEANKMLLATWNIANLGMHERTDDHYQLIAEMMSWFDIIAVQEVHKNLEGLYKLESYIGTTYELLFNDVGGNDERAAFFYDASKIERLQMIGELTIAPSQLRHIKLDGILQTFEGFDRNPYVGSFQFHDARFVLINAHLYFGSEKNTADKARRALEAFAVGRYADLERNNKQSFAPNYFALGDFNVPVATAGDPIFDALTKKGMIVPEHSTRIASSIMSDAQYDQVVFFPDMKRTIKANGVFDYDTIIFADLWQQQKRQFKSYCRYYISDHRPMWVQVQFD